jgi:hypothetical protein
MILSESHSDQKSDGTDITLKLSSEELASLVGTTSESLFRMISEFKLEEIIKQDRKSKEELEGVTRKQDQDELFRIAVTTAILMNMILFSISLYAGLTGKFKTLFEYITLFLSFLFSFIV